ncbi:MAG: outer membrane protein assembly factor BamD [Balneolaceae bacterium]|nr:MAG: outer membrane protein assembly factor BamD [Balneolaceae bacterium]
MLKRLLFMIAALTFMASCQSKELIRPGDTLEIAYDKALNQFNNENYSDAARAFETVISIGRGTDIGQDAQFFLAESHFRNRSYLIAASEFSRYVQFHSNSPRRQEAEFKEAISYYHMSPRYRLDQSNTLTAIEKFRLYNVRYPNSERAGEVAEYIGELRTKLAQRDFSAAEFYMRTTRYNSAAIYFGLVLDQYPETHWAERAVMRQMEAYILFAENSVQARQEERFRKALDSYSTYLQLFPQGESRSRVEELYDRANRGLNTALRRSEVAEG